MLLRDVFQNSCNYGTTGIPSVKGGMFLEDRFDDEYMGPFIEDERAYHDERILVVRAISTRHQPRTETKNHPERTSGRPRHCLHARGPQCADKGSGRVHRRCARLGIGVAAGVLGICEVYALYGWL